MLGLVFQTLHQGLPWHASLYKHSVLFDSVSQPFPSLFRFLGEEEAPISHQHICQSPVPDMHCSSFIELKYQIYVQTCLLLCLYFCTVTYLTFKCFKTSIEIKMGKKIKRQLHLLQPNLPTKVIQMLPQQCTWSSYPPRDTSHLHKIAYALQVNEFKENYVAA